MKPYRIINCDVTLKHVAEQARRSFHLFEGPPRPKNHAREYLPRRSPTLKLCTETEYLKSSTHFKLADSAILVRPGLLLIAISLHGI
jgi:hypothetical protein